MECAMVGRGGGALPRGRGPIIGGAGLHVLYNNEGGISLSFSTNIYLLSSEWILRSPGPREKWFLCQAHLIMKQPANLLFVQKHLSNYRII
jgi:hypothetical protein